MAFDKDAFLTALDSMTVLELNELVKAISKTRSVRSAAAIAPARKSCRKVKWWIG